MYKTILISLLSTIFVACSSTNALKYFKKDELEARAIQHTKKTDIMYKKEQEVIFWATYLNNIKQDDIKYENETFLTSTYFTKTENQEIEVNKYEFTLNGKKALSVKKLDENDEKYKNLMSQNKWGNYYLVTFKKEKKVYKLTLKLSNSNISSGQLKFEK